MPNDRACEHRLAVRVYYEDTDAAGIVYHANYLRFAERARTEFLRSVGIDHAEMRASTGVAFAVRHCTIDYLAPALLDDQLEVSTRLLEVSGASLRAAQTVWRGDRELVRMALRIVCIGASGRPTRLPLAVREALRNLPSPETRA